MATLAASDLDAFSRDGFFVAPDMLSDSECDDIVGLVEAAAFEVALGEPSAGQLSYRPMMHLASPALAEVATDPRWAPVVLPLVFSSLLMHRSGPNVTNDPRRAWIIQFCSAGARSALSKKVLDDRLLCARDGAWLDEPVRQREFDLMAVLANHDHA